MSKIWAIAKREVRSYYLSTIAYIIMGVFIFLASYFFNLILAYSRLADIRGVIQNMNVIFMFLAPIITMKLLSEEKKLGTMELLYTSPITVTEVVLGKYLASLIMFGVLFVLTLQFPLIISIVATPEKGPMLTSYLGFFFMGATFMAVGIFASSLGENQLVAAVLGFGMLLMFWIIGWAGDLVGGGAGNWISSLSVMNHFEDFLRGVIDVSNIFYYLGMIFLFLFLTVQRLEWKRW
jgi:ABC-2 type transport system permease protein